MSGVNKFTEQPSYEEIVQKLQDIIDALGSATGANTDLSNLSATGEAHFQEPLISGTNIKTINNTSLLGNGNIDTSEIFVATYGTTTYQEITNALTANKLVFAEYSDRYFNLKSIDPTAYSFSGLGHFGANENQELLISNQDIWSMNSTVLATSSQLGNCVVRTGDTMTGGLTVQDDVFIEYAGNKYFLDKNTSANYTNTTTPSETVPLGGFIVQDVNGKYLGGIAISHDNSNNITNTLYARRSIGGVEKSAYLPVYVDSSGNGHCSLPQTNSVDGQWVNTDQSLISSATSLNGSTGLTYRVDLPNDGQKYEVMFRGNMYSGSTSGSDIYLIITGNEDTMARYVGRARAAQAGTFVAIGTAICTISYVASGSTNLTVGRSTSYNGSCTELRAIAYRRIGSNS